MSTLPPAPRTRAEQFAFLRAAHEGPLVWHNQCLSLTRQAPGLPGGVPSANAAAVMVPAADRVHHVHELRRGMVLFYDNPNDDNPFGHVDTVAGWLTPTPTDSLHDLLTISSDVIRDGGVDYVRGDFVPTQWGAPLLYGSRSLEGFALPGYHTAPQAGVTYPIGHNLDVAIDAVRRALRYHRAHHHPLRVAALARDLAQLEKTRADYPKR